MEVGIENVNHSTNKHIAFIGKANQNARAVTKIHQSVLEQVKKDFPQKFSIIDKSDNTGCYHNKILICVSKNLIFKKYEKCLSRFSVDQCKMKTRIVQNFCQLPTFLDHIHHF